MKTCYRCGEEKEFSAFSKNRAKKDGLNIICRACVSQYTKARYRDPGPRGERSRQHSRKRSKIATETRKIPEHPYAWKYREYAWKKYGIFCLPGCDNNKGFFCRVHWQALWTFQGGRCGLCGGTIYRGIKPYPAVDHKHEGPKGEGPVRGILHGGKQNCNTRILGSYERQGRLTRDPGDDPLLRDCEAYISNPPAKQLAEIIAGIQAAFEYGLISV